MTNRQGAAGVYGRNAGSNTTLQAVLAVLLFTVGVVATGSAAAPTVVSSNPPDGATLVPTTSPLVISFDQEMDTNVTLFPSSPQFGLVGNFQVTAPGANPTLLGTWGDDGKSLTITPALQYPLGTLTWTLNPAGVLSFFTLKSKAGTELATVSGTFSTGVGGTDPKLGSSSPANFAINVATNTQVSFRFDLAMNTNIVLNGTPGAVSWGGIGIDATKFVYSWSADKKTLLCSYTGGFPLSTVVTWALNPSGAATKLVGENGKFVASETYAGQFTTGNGEPLCGLSPFPANWGTYSVSKRSNYQQTSSADPMPDTEPGSYVFSATVNPPSFGGGSVASASLTKPDNSVTNLSSIIGIAQYFETPDSEAELDAKFPAGTYTLRFMLTGQSENVIPMSMPAGGPPVPKITNFDEAQAINAAADFALRWNGFTGAGPNDHISMYLSDTNGTIVFQAPNLCVPRELPVTATSIVIPANYLQKDHTYTGALLYGHLFYFSTNAVPKMSGFGDLLRGTSFTIKTGTGGGVVPPIAAQLTGMRLLQNGNTQFQAAGTAGRAYSVLRAGQVDAPTWQEVGTINMLSDGTGIFEDTDGTKVFPLFYRVRGN